FLAGRRRLATAWIAAALLGGLTILLVRSGAPASVWLLACSTPVAAIAALAVLSRWPRWLGWVAAAELVIIAIGINPTAAAADRLPRPPALARLQALVAARPGRIIGIDGVLPPNVASRYGLADLRSFDPVRPWPLARLHALLGATDPVLPGPLHLAPPRLLGAWSVRYLVTPARREAPGWRAVASGDGIRIWENPFWQPEIRVAGRTVSLPEEQGWQLLGRDPEILTDGAVLPPGSAQAHAAHHAVQVTTNTSSRVEATVTCDGPCLFLVARPWAPGWEASVDDRRASLLRADLAALGVIIPPGKHQVEVSYHLY
ncbi:MAG: YfhO family protein, partial [Acidobacteria bacterium]|nr:YfhO family protein [Acidobacteriota bacterium]